MTELRECPLCSGPSRMNSVDFDMDGMDWYPSCTECGLAGVGAGTEEDAAALWNRRPAEDELLDALEGFVDELATTGAVTIEGTGTKQRLREARALTQKHRPEKKS